MTLRFRLFGFAAGIVAISLLLSGALTWLLVTQLEIANAQQRLVRDVGIVRTDITLLECAVPGARVCTPATQQEFESRLSDMSTRSAGERIILITPEGTVVYDSQGGTVGTRALDVSAVRSGNAATASATLGDTKFVGAVALLGPAGTLPSLAARRDPLGAAYVFLARPSADITSQAALELLPRLLLAGGVSLLFALLIALLLSRGVTRPLSELAAAAEDIAAGNYSRRVSVTGSDEVGVVGRSFNRMAEAVERARGLQRDFLANVSHELKTPLTSLIGFSQALMDGSLRTESEKRRAASILHEEAQRVLRMAQELLDLARVETGHISYHPVAVDLAALLDQEVEIVRQRAEARRLNLKLDVPRQLPPVKADPERLHQILENIFDNAVKYAPEGSEVLARAAADAGRVEISVANPAGDHRPDPDKMFERFYRADPSRASGAGGVGLGLAISHQLAAAMEGRLWADYDDVERLRLRLVLPAAAVRQPGLESEPRPAA